jgi:hypothetical protein
MTRIVRTIAAASVAMCVAGGSLAAQTTEGSKTAPAHDPSARLWDVLPADVAKRVTDRIAAARARELPAQALENRALKFAARGVKPEEIERAIAEHATRLEQSKQALEAARAKRPSNDEVEAAAEAIRTGVDGSKISEIARNAPKDRPLAVAFSVLSALANSGVPVAEAVKRVDAAMTARASDAELEKLSAAAQAAEAKSRKPAVVGRDLAQTKRPGGASAGGPPSGVPANGGAGVAPARPQPPVSRP